jgi:Tfp pilus assembly protein PilW
VSPRHLIADERGTTLVELMVGLAMGMVVLATLTLAIVVTLHASTRVSARVEATQNGRVVLTRVIEELHSACVAPKIAPIQAGSTGTSLSFIRAAGSEGAAVAPTPTLTTISYSEGVLTQSDYAATGGSAPSWTFAATPTTRRLLSNVSPGLSGGAVFNYFSYAGGSLSSTPQTTPLTASEAALTVVVKVALKASAAVTPVADKPASSTIQDSAVLRLTPPSFNEQASALPCQ